MFRRLFIHLNPYAGLGVDQFRQHEQASKKQPLICPMSWSAQSAIRTRREQIGLSQTDLAQALGVTKSLMSHIEAGKRQPTEDQIATLSTMLRLPPDLLLLGSGRLPDYIRDAFRCQRGRGRRGGAPANRGPRRLVSARTSEPTSANRNGGKAAPAELSAGTHCRSQNVYLLSRAQLSHQGPA